MDRKTYLNTGAVVIKDKKILLVQEADPLFHGKWNFPLGQMKLAEVITDAAIREVYEETGYQIKLTGFLGVYQSLAMSDRNVIIFMFTAQVISGKLKPEKKDLIQAKWFTREEFGQIPDSYLMNSEMRNVVNQAFDSPADFSKFTNLE